MRLDEFVEHGQSAQEAVDKIIAAHALVGKRVTWASEDVEPATMTVTHATADGMVEVTGMTGQFAPHIFKVVDDA